MNGDDKDEQDIQIAHALFRSLEAELAILEREYIAAVDRMDEAWIRFQQMDRAMAAKRRVKGAQA